MASLVPSESDSESTVQTEVSAGDAYRDAFEPYRVEARNPGVVKGFREWWLKNPLNNLWTKKPNLWRTYQAEQAGLDPAEAVKSGANVKLADLVQRDPRLEDVLDEGDYELQPLPSDEAWFGEPDPSIYAPGTNDLSKEQLAQEVAKGNVCTLRQLKQHLLTASESELEAWRQMFAAQSMKEEMFVDTPEGPVSLWDLLMYVRGNPELESLAARDLNLAVPVEGMTREERIAQLAELAPWRLCANERQMTLPPEAAAKLPWGLLAGGSWWHRRPARWLKGLGGQRDFYYGLYVHEDAAQQLMNDKWGGRAPSQVLADKAFYREALGLGPSMGMTLLAVASRPLPLHELTTSWQERLKQQMDKLGPEAANSSSSSQQGSGRVFMSTSSGSLGSSSSSSTETGSSEEESSSSSEVMAAAAATAFSAATMAAAAAAPAASKPAPAPQKAAAVQQVISSSSSSSASVSPAPPPQQRQQQQQVQAAQAPQLKQQPAPAQQQQQQVVQQPAAQQPQPQLQQQQLALRQQQAALQQQQQQQQSAVVSPQKDIEPQYAGLARLVRLFDADRLAGQTELLDPRGTKLREGSMIMFTAHPTGALMVQAVSPGLVKEQRSYLLGSVFDPPLTRALMSMFMDPDHTLDPEFTAAAGATLLAFVNGARQGQAQAVVPVVPGGSLEDGRRLLRHGKWRLPALGQAPEQDTLLSGVRRAVVYQQIGGAFEAALRAAAAVQVPQDADPQDAAVQRRVVFERRYAAEMELKKQLGELGLDTSSLNLKAWGDAQQAPQDLLSLARPLAS